MPGPIFQFGDFELDCASFQLLRKGRALRIERKPMELLILLVSRRGELATRAEIAEKLWPGDVFVDTDHGINTAIRKLRHLLRDDADGPVFIQTVTGMGYRFIARVAQVDREGTNALTEVPIAPQVGSIQGAVSETTSALPAVHRPRRQWRWIVGIAVFIALATLLLRRLDRADAPPPRIARSLQLTSDGREKFPSVVTDGERVYFSELANEHLALSAVPISDGEPFAISLPFPDAQVLNISPDKSELLISEGAAIQDNPLWRVPILGGTPRRMGSIVTHAASWSPDRKKLIYMYQGDVYLANGDGGEAKRIELPATTPNTWAWTPRWSPDGKRIRFERYVMDQHLSALWEMSATGKNPLLLLPNWQKQPMLCCGEWSPDGSLYFFDAWQYLEGGSPLAPAPDIWVRSEKSTLLHKSGAEPIQITSGPVHFFSHAFSPDGKSLFALSTQRREQLSLYDPKTQNLTGYPGLGPAHSISFSRDGRIAYAKFPQGELWRKNADGSKPLQLTFRPLMAYGPEWSADGKQIVFYGQEAGQRLMIYSVSAEGGEARKILNGAEANYFGASWSPDGDSIVFTSESNPTPPHIEVFNLRTLQRRKVPGSEGLEWASWSPDGKYISALSTDGRLKLFELEKSTWSTLLEDVRGQAWSRDGSSLYLISSRPKLGVFRLSIKDKRVREIVSLSGVQISDTYGQPLFLSQHDEPIVRQQTALETEVYALSWDAH